jgi:FkbM family methyltransferase
VIMSLWKRAWRNLNSLRAECRACVRESHDTRSSIRLCADFFLFRFVPFLPEQFLNRERQVELRDGVKLRYRLNRGDIQSIREIWLEGAYRLPFPVAGGALIDLGANIGFTSVWLTKRYGFTRVIAVEPDKSNAALVRKNFQLNEIPGMVVDAAVGPQDGTAKFQQSAQSNVGRLSDEGHDIVAVMSMRSIIDHFELCDIDLMKMDIEGGEQALLTGPLEWLNQTKAIIAEFHPEIVDYPLLTGLLERRGFKYVPANSAFPNNMDSFCRIDATVE